MDRGPTQAEVARATSTVRAQHLSRSSLKNPRQRGAWEPLLQRILWIAAARATAKISYIYNSNII
jgi:hypothetical protein